MAPPPATTRKRSPLERQRKRRKAKYAYIISITPEGMKKFKGKPPATSHIGWTRNPPRRLLEHNRKRGYYCGQKTTQQCAPYWQMELVITGIVKDLNGFCRSWRENSRKLERRILYGIRLAAAMNNPLIKYHARDPAYIEQLKQRFV
jgi:hypothetical protein